MKQLDSRTLQYIAKAYGKKFAGDEEDPSASEVPQSSEGSAIVDQVATPEEDAPNVSIDPNATVSRETPGLIPTPTGPESQADMNAQTQSAPTPVPPDPNAALEASRGTASFDESFEQQKEANIEEAKAKEAEGTSEAAAEQAGFDKFSKLPTANDIAQKLDLQAASQMKAYQDNKLDPNHYYNNQSTGQKVLSGIALVLGGIGGGGSGQPNLAAQMIDDSIKRDIDAQKNSQDQQMNLWKMNRQQYQDDTAANAATQNQIFTGVQYQLNKAAATAKGPLAAAAALAGNGAINQQKAKNNALIVLHSVLSGQTKESGDEASFNQALNNAQVIAPDMAKSAMEKYIPAVGIAKVPVTPADRDSVTLLNNLDDNINRAITIQQSAGKLGTWSPVTNKQANEVRDELNVQLNQLNSLKRLNPLEYENFKDQIGKIGGINFGGTLEGLNALKGQITSKKAIQYDQLGITPFSKPLAPAQQAVQQQQPSNQPPPTTNTVVQRKGPDGKIYNYHWNVRSQRFE